MKRSLIAPMLLALLAAGCTAVDGPGLQPIPGSITYKGQPRTKLTKSPVGSIVPHQFFDEWGRPVQETYVIQPDRSLKLVSRRSRPQIFPDF